MNKHLQLPVDIELVHHSGQTVLRLGFHREALRDWCLGLTLVNEGLIENLSVTGERRTKGVQVQLGAKPDGVGPVRVSLNSDPIRVEIQVPDSRPSVSAEEAGRRLRS